MTPLKVTDLDHSHYIRLHMTAKVPPNTTLEDVMNPGFWVNHVNRLKRGTIIEVLAEDNTLDCELRVLDVGATFATVRVLRNYVAAEAPVNTAAPPDDIVVGYGGRGDRWRVLHQEKVVQAGFETKEAAQKAAEEYRSKFAA